MSDTLLKVITGGIIVLLLFGVGFCTGYKTYPKLKPCAVIDTTTTVITDPYWHHIADSLKNVPPKEVWKWHPRDTVRLPGEPIILPVDSATIKAMLEDYLATYSFSHEIEDNDTLDAIVNVLVNKNRPIAFGLDYKFKIPFITNNFSIDNSITYSSYLQIGFDLPLYTYNLTNTEFNIMNNISLEADYVFSKGALGVGWQPYDKTFSASAKATIFKFKHRK